MFFLKLWWSYQLLARSGIQNKLKINDPITCPEDQDLNCLRLSVDSVSLDIYI
jgi:hypothetical protein